MLPEKQETGVVFFSCPVMLAVLEARQSTTGEKVEKKNHVVYALLVLANLCMLQFEGAQIYRFMLFESQ